MGATFLTVLFVCFQRQIKLRRDTLDGITEHEGLLHDLSSILQTGNYEEQFDRLRTNPKVCLRILHVQF